MSMTVDKALAVVAAALSDVPWPTPGADYDQALATLRAEIADIRRELDATIEQRDLLSREVLRIERDADRYRWLRDESDDVQWREIGEAINTDAAIDAARQQESSHEG